MAGTPKTLNSLKQRHDMSKKFLYLALLLTGCVGSVWAQNYPSKPIKMVVPYPAGGAADITARVLGQKMSESMGVPILVDNKPGANGMIGTDAVAKALPDGYTLLLDASGPLVVNPALYAKVPYDPVKDLMPISQVTTFQYVMVVPASSPISSVAELVTAAKSKPGELSYGSTGVGGGGHLAGELLGLMTGTKLTHAPYKGSAPALADLLGGQLSFTFDTVITSVPQVKAGKLKALGVSTRQRSPLAPEVPTIAEAGVKGYEMTYWFAAYAPIDTPHDVLTKLNDMLVKAAHSPSAASFYQLSGIEIFTSSQEELRAFQAAEVSKWGRVIKSAGIEAE